MDEFSLPPSPNWFSSGTLSSSPLGFVAYSSQNQIVILEVPEVPVSCDESWREESTGLNPPKSFIINDAHEDKTKVCSVSWCPNPTGGPAQQNLASAADDGSVKVWRWSKEFCSLVGKHTLHSENRAKVFGLDWSKPDPSLVVSADETGCIVCWDLTSNRTRKLGLGKYCVFSLALHPEDPDIVGFGCKLGLVIIASLAGNGRIIHKMRGHDEDCYGVSWCPVYGTDWRLVSSSRDKTLRIWSHAQGKSTHKLKLPQGSKRGYQQGQSSSFLTCQWLDENRILSSGESGELVLWDLNTPEKKDGYKFDILHREHNRSLFSICVSGNLVYSVGQDRIVTVLQINSKRVLYSLPTLNGFAYCLASNPIDPSILAIGAGDGLIRVWKTGSQKLFDLRHLRLNQSKVMSLAWHPVREGLLALGTDEGRVGWVDALGSRNQISFSNFQHRGGVYSVTWGPGIADDSDLALYTVGEGKLVQHNTKTEKFFDIFSFPEFITGNKPNVSQALWKTINDKNVLVLGLDDGSVQFYHIPGFKLFMSLKSHKKLIQSLEFSPDFLSGGEEAKYKGWLATASNENDIHLWDLGSILAGALSAEPGEEPLIFVTPTATLVGHCLRVIELAWSPHKDGKLVSVSYDCSAQVWDVETLLPTFNFQGHSKRLMCCLWHPTNPDLVLSGGEDCSLVFWIPEKQTVQKPVLRKKKKGKVQEIELPEVEIEEKKELSFEELLEKHRKSQEKRTDPEHHKPEREPEPTSFNAKTAKRTKRITKKSFFPVSSRTEGANLLKVGEDCLKISKFRNNEEPSQSLSERLQSLNLDETVPVLPGAEEQAYLGFFYGKDGVSRLLETESKDVEDFPTKCTHSLWMGNLAETLKLAESEGSLTEGLVALSAGLSQVVWRQTAVAYAVQLNKEDNFMKSSEFLLSVHMVYEAIDVLRRNNAFQAALAIAITRLPESDPLIQELMVGWAQQAVQSGNLQLAAKCWVAAGRNDKAADTLGKISTKSSLKAAIVLSDDSSKSEIYARQLYTECLFSLDTDLWFSVSALIPSLAWGSILILVFSHIHQLLKSDKFLTEHLFALVESTCSEKNITCDKSQIPVLDQFIKTTTNSDKFKVRILPVAGFISLAFISRSDPQLCLKLISQGLAELHSYPGELERVSKFLLPDGTQPQEVGKVLLSTSLDWQCNWPELRSIQCSEALSVLKSKETVWNEQVMMDVADAFMQEDVIFSQKIIAEISEAEEALSTFDPEKESLPLENGNTNGTTEPGEVIDLTPSLTGTQTVSLGGDGNWKSDGISAEIALPPQGLENLPPPPKPTTSFYVRFLQGRSDSLKAQEEIQKLKWILSKQSALLVPYPDLTQCCRDLLLIILEKKLGSVSQEEEEEQKKLSFSKKLARFGYYKGTRINQQFFLKHS